MKNVLWVLIAGNICIWIASCGQSPAPKSADDVKAEQLAMTETTNQEDQEASNETAADSAAEPAGDQETVNDDADALQSADVYGSQYEDEGGGDDDDDDDDDDEGDADYEDDAGDLF